jgi:hypothetical protein
VSREDVEVSLAVARDLGPGSEVAVVSEFLDRVGPAIDARVDAEVDARLAEVRRDRGDGTGQPALGFVSVALGIPITAITVSSGDGGIVATAIAWAGIAAVNLAAGRRRP